MDEGCQLISCGSCSRHVCSAAIACPFCGVGLNPNVAVPEFRFRTRLRRSARFAIGAALVSAGFAIEGCSSTVQPVYGVPAPPPCQPGVFTGCSKPDQDAGKGGAGEADAGDGGAAGNPSK